MIDASNEFKKAVYAPIRTCKARVRFEVLDTGAFKDNVKKATSEATISRLTQVTDKVRKMDGRYATFEKDYFRLDGSFVLPPKPVELTDKELGWWSNDLCNAQGTFNPFQTLEFNFSQEHSSRGLTICFDVLNDEWASEFDIDAYGASGGMTKHESIMGNESSRYVYVGQLFDYKRIVITIKKWCKGHRRVKVVEVDFGIIKEYEDNNLIKMSILQELNPTSSTLPADELKFTVDNSSKEFNMLNPDGFYEFLQQGQECFAEIGIVKSSGDVEYVEAGKYYLKQWQSDEGTLTATFTARDVLDSLSNDEVESSVARDINLYDLAAETLNTSGIENYVLSSNLKLIRTKGLHKKMSCRNLLQLIAIAGMCVVYSDNLGVFRMKQLISAKAALDSVTASNEARISNKNQVINNILEPSLNLATFEKDRFKLDGSFHIPGESMSCEVGWLSNDLSDVNGVFTTPLVLEMNLFKDHVSKNFEILFDTLNKEYAAEFELKVYDDADAIKINERITNDKSRFFYENSLLENSRKIVISIKKWSAGSRRARISEIGFDLPVDNITFDNMYKEPQIELQQAVKAVEVTYYPSDMNNKAIYTSTRTDVKEGTILKLESSLINTETDAKNVAEWILNEHNRRAIFKVDWRQNPALNLGDKVSIENGYGTNNIANIIKQEINYQGYLSGKTEAKGVI